ncbi:DUF808 domain-containing protein [Uliginosibacterium sp. 31-12]|uniref:DUF808 domain-containing protein n=1 Tax=Uliginosibacterium sp. 31-12 TaxID=3062781 RepID=UPI0026E428ED|nr:DUF808 domain-containing protein [Uliginosibacterium sp. 31-12]MDO6385253.1 DUF808 domain-containing protein [Uliginosibacterium sp. 31-12]
MAGSSLLVLIDDIATLLDDVALMSKVAAKKTAGVLGDDLALNAQQVTGISADRELPVVWAVALGSLRNKLILVPSALLISAIAPWLVMPLLMIGGAYLCFEGFEKIAHKFLHAQEEASEHAERLQALQDPSIDMRAFEREKIKGAVRTDFILSAEIIVIALGTVANEPFMSRLLVLATIGFVMTIGVYGFVALIVKLDDAGLYLNAKQNIAARKLGQSLLWFAPWLMKALSVAGTIAMFLVGGAIVLHGIPGSHALQQQIEVWVHDIPLLPSLLPTLVNALAGILTGALCVLLLSLLAPLISGLRKAQ